MSPPLKRIVRERATKATGATTIRVSFLLIAWDQGRTGERRKKATKKKKREGKEKTRINVSGEREREKEERGRVRKKAWLDINKRTRAAKIIRRCVIPDAKTKDGLKEARE